MKRVLPDTLAGRMIAVLLLGLVVFHLFSVWAAQVGIETVAGVTRDRQLAERLASVVRAISGAPSNDRERQAHALSTTGLEVRWAPAASVTSVSHGQSDLRSLRTQLREMVAELAEDDLRLDRRQHGTGDESARPGSFVGSIRMADGTWINFSAGAGFLIASTQHGILLSTTAMALGIVAISVILVRWVIEPLRSLTDAAARVGVDVSTPGMPEAGPREVRDAARAFNQMQERIRRLLADRTQTLAAVSHDLKTPITRLRLRAEFIADQELRREVGDDLGEMEAMIESVLAFLRDHAHEGETKTVDIAAVLETICDHHGDAGHAVTLVRPTAVPLPCKPLAIKRALSNLIDNAVRYGGNADVTLIDDAREVRIVIRDNGPGIPEGEIEKVFNPFFRLEESRSRDTGGTGLGLTISRTIVRAHGGDVRLENRPNGGLVATVTLPKIVR